MAIPDSIGVSFAPTREASELAPQRARAEGLQEAIRVLSLHVPQVLGGRPVAAGELLRASGGGDEVSAVVESVLRSVMGGQAAAGPTVGAAGGPGIPGATRAVGTAPAAPDTSTMLAQAVQTLARSRAIPRLVVGPGAVRRGEAPPSGFGVFGPPEGTEGTFFNLPGAGGGTVDISNLARAEAARDPFARTAIARQEESAERFAGIDALIEALFGRGPSMIPRPGIGGA